uniref:Uncharacterized protein n=1 Tax=Marseillevirus LCMAC101 TaxID=2506602 RepID=A0A481YS91_9VIRU|nr:MAG: hypothetical protein LCMAC101_06730 [Marseillevirus LCMAC101]
MALSTGAKVGIGIGIGVGLIVLGLLIWFVIWPAIANAIEKGKEYSYNGGGSGNNGYIRKWIDDHMLSCSETPNMCIIDNGDEECTRSAGFAQLLTQDGEYILCYKDSKIFLSPTSSSKDENIWYLCFQNKNFGDSAYAGRLVAANQLCNGTKNLCNLFWECSSTQGDQPCSGLTNYKNSGNYPPDLVRLDSACSVKNCNLSYNKCVNKSDSSGNNLPCLEAVGKNEYPVEQSVYINSDDTISTDPEWSKSHTHHNVCDDGGKGCMNNTYYLGIDYPEYTISPTLISQLGIRFKIVDCDATQTDGRWTCLPPS